MTGIISMVVCSAHCGRSVDDVEQIRSGDRHNFRAPLWRGNVKEVRVLTCLVKACNAVFLKDIG